MQALRIILATVLLSASVAELAAQVARDSGNISGHIVASGDSGISGVTVEAWRGGSAAFRTTRTGEDGSFILALMPSGVYHVGVSVPGVPVQARVPVEVRVGETAVIRVPLGYDSPVFGIQVNEGAISHSLSRTQQASTLELHRIRNLPINRRDYLGFAVLVPGVVDASAPIEQSDFRPPITPASSLGFSGNNGRGNAFSIDGLSINGASYNVRPSLPQAAVQEFQVNRNSYSAELGGASGGVVNIASKSGTNDWHGEIFGFLRHTPLQARYYFDPARASYTRQQSGAEVSGPLYKDRILFHAAFERLDLHESAFVPILQDKSVLTRLPNGQQQLLDFLGASADPTVSFMAGRMKTALVPASNPQVVELFEKNSGVFPLSTSFMQPSLKLDAHQATHHLFARFDGTSDRSENVQLGALVGRSNGNSQKWLTGNAAFGDTWMAGARWIAETRAGFAYSNLRMLPNDPTGPEILINGYGQFGRSSLFPLYQRERYVQLLQNMRYSSPRHSLKFGVDLHAVRNSSHIHTFFSGRFVFGEYIPLGTVMDAMAGSPELSGKLGAALVQSGRSDLASSLAHPISSLQAYSLGLPVAYFQGFGGTGYRTWRQNHAAFIEDSWRALPSLTITAGVRFQADRPNAIRPVNNFAPRLGFAWSPDASRQTVIRGGYGMFHEWIMAPIPFGQVQITRPDVTLVYVPLSGVPWLNNPQTGVPVNSADIYQSLAARGVLGTRTPQPSDLTPLGIPETFRFPITGGVQSDYSSPYAQHASLQLERSFGSLSAAIGWEFSRGAHLWRMRDHNLVQTGVRPGGWPIAGRRNPLISNEYFYESAANSFYNAVIIQVAHRMRMGTVSAHYTVSRALDEVTDFNLEYQPHNPFDARADRGLSAFHQKHRFVATAVFESPWKSRCSSSAAKCILSDWTMSAVVKANSARPFNILAGIDNIGDGQVTNHRPLGLGRNVGIGPGFQALDLRLAREVVADGRVRVRFLVEAFNVLNRTNFRNINSVVGDVPLSALPPVLKGRRGNPTEPFSFTAAHGPRQLQLGIQVSF